MTGSMIKTLDAMDLIAKRMAMRTATYPDGSLSPRTVFFELPVEGDRESLAKETNAAITRAIYQDALDFAEAEAKKPKKRGFTPVSDFIPKSDDKDAREKRLIGCVERALSSINPKKR